MTFFNAKEKQPRAPVPERYQPASRAAVGDRQMMERRAEHDAFLRSQGRLKEGKGRAHTTSALPLDRKPRGVLFTVIVKGREIGFFDLDGYWCRKVAGGMDIRRNAERKVMKHVDKARKQQLIQARVRAVKAGAR